MVTGRSSSSGTCYEHVYNLLEEIFESCITEADTSELIANLSDLYESFSGQGFESSFEKILLYVLSESKRSTDVTKILRFISESVVTLDNKYKTAATKERTVEDIDDVVHPLLKYLFKTLNRWSNSSSYTVRFRCCQLLFMILTYIQDHGMGEIDMDTYEIIAKLIESRRLDVSSNVRAHAVLLAKFFQDPTVVNDPVIDGLCWQLQHDPNHRVRQNIVSIIAACEETVTPVANRFLYDKNANVRNAALLHICKRIGPRSFTTYQRILILQHCFTDPSDLVRRNAQHKLIPVWFRACDDKLSNFLKYLRMDNECLDNLPFMKQLTKLLSKCVKISQLFEEIEIDTNSCLPKTPLSGEKVFLWRHFFNYANKEERLSRFIPPLDILIPFILKCFDDTSSEEVEISVFTELILFLMDIMEALGIKNCEDVFPMALNLMRHPFVPHDIMPYLVVLYLTYSPKEKEQVLEDIVQVIEDLQKLLQFTQGQELNILRKCFAIASQVLTEATTLTANIKSIKDNLIIHHLSSENTELKVSAISALALYCLLDLKEAKLSWPLFANAMHIESSQLKNILLESVFDVLKCHGQKIFSDVENSGQKKFDETLLEMFTCLEDGKSERDIVVRGTLKLFMEHHTLSPIILANLVIQFFYSEDCTSTQYYLERFFPVFGETKEGANCLVKAFLEVINLSFNANKNSRLYKIDVKKIALQLLEFSKNAENQLADNTEEKFQDLLVVKLTKKFLKKPWRLTALNLYNICCHIIPERFDTLFKLKENVLQIIESLQSSVFQQKNPYPKKNIKNFSTYLKKIQLAMNTAPMENLSKVTRPSAVQKKLDFNSFSSKENSFCSETDIPIESSTTTEDISVIQESTDSKLDVSSSSVTEHPEENSNSSNKITVTPRKIATPSHTFKTPLVRHTPSQGKIKFRTPAPPETVMEDTNFKTPKLRKTPSRKRQLDISLTKTA